MHRKKLFTIAAVAFGMIAAFGPPTFAAGTPAGGAHAGHSGKGQMTLKKMAKALNLTDAQVAQLKAIHADVMQRSQAIRADGSLSTDDKKSQLKALHQTVHKKMRSVLTQEQREKLRALRAAARGNGADQNQAESPARHSGRKGQNDGARGAHPGAHWAALGLTDDQKTKIKAIHADARAQVQAVRADSSLGPEARTAKLRSIRQGAMGKVREVLTPAQREKLGQMLKTAREHRNAGAPQ